MMELSVFIDKLNKVDGKVYVIEEKIQIPAGGIYEAELQHDNIVDSTLAVYTGPTLTGEQIQTYALSTPSLMPWKRIIRIQTDAPVVYISYETDGDTVEAQDINIVQDAILATQGGVNAEEARAKSAEAELTRNLQAETDRATGEEQRLDGRIDVESGRAQDAENALSSRLDAETERAEAAEQENAAAIEAEEKRAIAAEKVLTDSLSAEVSRATTAEKVNANNISAEIARAKARECDLQGSIDMHIASVNGEVQALKAADTALDEKKANASDVNKELANRYTKSQVFTKEEVLKKIEDLIGTAPDTLDTFKEIADALGNDPNFATTIMNLLAGKVDKETGKQLTSNDYSDSEKAIVADVNIKKHSHSNKYVLDKLTQALLDTWNTVTNKVDKVTCKGLSTNDFTTTLLNKLNGIAEGANKYVHPTTSGNKHIPAGGASGQVLKWSADGTAAWGTDNNSDTKVTQTNTTGSADYRVVMSGNANDTTETNTARKSANFLANPATGEFYAKGYRRINITGQTLNVNTLNLSAGAPCIMRYIEKTSGGAANITNIPVAGQPFLLDVELIRWASLTDYITRQVFVSATTKMTYERFCSSGTWSAWVQNKYAHPNSGVAAGTYRSVTVNAQGHVTGGTNPNTLAGYGITDAAAKNHNHDSVYLKKGAITWNDLKGI